MLLSDTKKLLQTTNYDHITPIANTDDVLADIPQLSTLKRQHCRAYDIDVVSRDYSHLPDEIKMRLLIKPMPMTPPMITAQLKHDQRLLQACRFYHMESIDASNRDLHKSTLWTGIDLLFEGTTHYRKQTQEWPLLVDNQQFKLSYQKDQLIGHHPFVLPDQPTYLQTNMRYQNKHRITHLGNRIQGMNISILIPYGGYVPQALNINNICQAYALINEAYQNKTHLSLYTQHYLNKNNIQLSSSQQQTSYHLCANQQHLPTIRLTLAGWLMQGHLQIKLVCLKDDTEHIYQSFACQQTDVNSNTVDVTFRKNA